MSKVGVEGKPRRSNVWVRLRKRLNRKGVVEVDVDHHRYKMLNILRQGIQDLLLNHQELGPKVYKYFSIYFLSKFILRKFLSVLTN